LGILSRTRGAIAFAGLVVGLTLGQATQPAAPASLPADAVAELRAEVTPHRFLVTPSQAVWVRFTLSNPTDSPIELPDVLAPSSETGVTLPAELVFGPTGGSTLTLTYSNERPVELRGPVTAGSMPLRIAPHGSVGFDVDLRPLHREFRYSGRYRVEWKPLGGRIPPAAAELRVESRVHARLYTDYGPVTFVLYYDKAPQNVENFLSLARDKFYDNKLINRVIPDFILQGGTAGDRNETRPDGRTIAAEFHDAAFDIGTLAMAIKPGDPNSASSQFFVTLARLPEFDGKYTAIGQARDESSLKTLRAIQELPTNENNRPLRPLTILSITLVPEESTRRTELKPR
jgi:peptidyl-prolyl cis-trans isomerase B (cyclophilin B)